MKKTIAIIDGYNVINRVPQFRCKLDLSLMSARQALVDFCADCLVSRRDYDEFVVVFDGDSAVAAGGGEFRSGVRVLFTPTKVEADDKILSLIRENGAYANCVVVSNDNYVSANSRIHGARTLDSCMFFKMLERRKVSPPVRIKEDSDGLSPAEERDINEWLKKELGLE